MMTLNIQNQKKSSLAEIQALTPSQNAKSQFPFDFKAKPAFDQLMNKNAQKQMAEHHQARQNFENHLTSKKEDSKADVRNSQTQLKNDQSKPILSHSKKRNDSENLKRDERSEKHDVTRSPNSFSKDKTRDLRAQESKVQGRDDSREIDQNQSFEAKETQSDGNDQAVNAQDSKVQELSPEKNLDQSKQNAQQISTLSDVNSIEEDLKNSPEHMMEVGELMLMMTALGINAQGEGIDQNAQEIVKGIQEILDQGVSSLDDLKKQLGGLLDQLGVEHSELSPAEQEKTFKAWLQVIDESFKPEEIQKLLENTQNVSLESQKGEVNHAPTPMSELEKRILHAFQRDLKGLNHLNPTDKNVLVHPFQIKIEMISSSAQNTSENKASLPEGNGQLLRVLADRKDSPEQKAWAEFQKQNANKGQSDLTQISNQDLNQKNISISTNEKSPTLELATLGQSHEKKAEVNPLVGLTVENQNGVSNSKEDVNLSTVVSGKIELTELKDSEKVSSYKSKDDWQSPVLKQVGNQIKTMASEGLQQLKIQLKPEHLGAVEIEMISRHDSLQVKVKVENQQVKNMLEQNLQLLKEQLDQQSQNVQKVEVTIDVRERLTRDQQGFGEHGHKHHKHTSERESQEFVKNENLNETPADSKSILSTMELTA